LATFPHPPISKEKNQAFVVEKRYTPAVIQDDSVSRCFKRVKMREDKKNTSQGELLMQ